MFDNFRYKESFLIITLDSCRWDSFCVADTSNMNTIGKFRKAYTHGTYTMPAHLSIYGGILPNTREEVPYYNRFRSNFFRISERSIKADSYIEFPKNTLNIISGLQKLGYSTYGVGAMSWFKHPILYSPFKEFLYTGIDIESQINFIVNKVKKTEGPYFLFLNVGETHEPYEFGGKIKESYKLRDMMRSQLSLGFINKYFEKQISCIEFVDRKIYLLINKLCKYIDDLIIIITGDHGECFGEDGCYGHGFYHEKIMEVPLVISKI